jgi:hypothetical protein
MGFCQWDDRVGGGTMSLATLVNVGPHNDTFHLQVSRPEVGACKARVYRNGVTCHRCEAENLPSAKAAAEQYVRESLAYLEREAAGANP